MNLRYYIDRLSEPLRKSGYFDLLKGLVASSEMEELLAFLENHKNTGQRFSPSLKNLFNAFTSTPLPELKAVLINSFPCEKLGQSNGLAFGTAKTKDKPYIDSLYRFYQSVSSNPECEPSLEFLAKQGVLLLNQGMTVPLDPRYRKKHRDAWSFFIAYLLDMLDSKYPTVPVILFGKEPTNLNVLLTKGQSFQVADPDPERCRRIFDDVNKFLEYHNSPTILF